jgi:hypothetical protein
MAPRSQKSASVPSLAAALALAFGACGAPPRSVDAQTASATESAEIAIRFDVSTGRPKTAQVLAFRATTTVTGTQSQSQSQLADWHPDVLGIVDPLAAAAPEQGCALRDIDLAATTLMLRGGSIELQEMTGIGVGVGPAGLPSAETLLRPFPRLYPDVATIVGGVVAEAGPTPLAALPERVTLFTAESELPVADLAVPSAPRLAGLNGALFEDGAMEAGVVRVDAQNGLGVTVSGGAGGRVELRPFGSTIAATCTIPAAATGEAFITIPRALVAQLARATGAPLGAAIPASLEIARRTHIVQGLGATYARVSVEVRSATTVELRP